MPNTSSAKKRIKQSEASRDRNRTRRSALKTGIRKFLDAVHDSDVGRAKEELRLVNRMLDMTAAKGTLHRNTSSRKKSRLAARFNTLVAAGT